MFANTSLCVMNLAFPDVCNVPTPAGPIPTPLVNIALSCSHIPTQFNVIIGGGLAENLLTQGTLSSGDEAGLGLGLLSALIKAPDRAFLGSFKVITGCAFATRLTSPTLQNGLLPNAAGLSLTPSQFCVLVLS